MLVTVKSVGGSTKKIQVESARTWADLKNNLNENSISYDNMKAIVGVSNVSLDLDDAVIPQEDFVLFLLPVKVKSGALKYTKDFLLAVEKQIKSKKSATYCAAKLGISEAEFIEAKSYIKVNGTKPNTVKEVKTTNKVSTSKTKTVTKTAVTEVVTDTKKTLTQRLKEAKSDEEVQKILAEEGYGKSEKTSIVSETEEQRLAREQKLKEEAENRALEEEAKHIQSSLNKKGLLVKDRDKN